MPWKLSASFVFVLWWAGLLCCDVARAQHSTHFSLEAQAGPWFRGGLGTGVSVLWGAGGKLPGQLLRMYFLLEAGAATTYEGDEYKERQDRFFGGLGMRALLPLTPQLRVFGDLLGGFAAVDAELKLPVGVPIEQHNTHWQWTLALGSQYRFDYAWSVGLRVHAQRTGEPLALLRQQLGLANRLWAYGITGGLTWHY